MPVYLFAVDSFLLALVFFIGKRALYLSIYFGNATIFFSVNKRLHNPQIRCFS